MLAFLSCVLVKIRLQDWLAKGRPHACPLSFPTLPHLGLVCN
ncbi:hypothetical protein BN2497_7907 [Janthinobacterium sp. CG23_2]|nr:hypothetical protein BN2497_7907 [Janthinobacterium sp. CG23_2]CUU30351.1 hypothetical protein BN3177_7907 [Janthinobacterium sp. CG23_2]